MGTSDTKLPWWQLTLFGVGCTIGTGFFLGSSMAIKKSGYGVLMLFVLAALATFWVYEALAQMTAKQPEKSSFRAYARAAFGRWAGFSMGWIYWCSELLILGSSLTALGLFSQFWWPKIPLWLFVAGYALLALLVVILGSKGVNKAENVFALIKIAAVLMFILTAGLAFLKGTTKTNPLPSRITDWSGSSWHGAWQGLIYAFYAFGGIEVMGFMAMDLRNPKDAPRAGRLMLIGVTVLYVFSIGLALLALNPQHVASEHKSPFIAALEIMGFPVRVHLLNGVFIIAGFSILVASLYAISTMLVALAEDGDAPVWLARTSGKRQLPLHALGVNTLGMCVSIVLALVLPKQIFGHLTTAAGLVLLYTWLFILASYLKLLKPRTSGRIKSWSAVALIAAAVSGTLLEKSGRPGFWSSLMIVLIIALITCFMRRRWMRNGVTEP